MLPVRELPPSCGQIVVFQSSVAESTVADHASRLARRYGLVARDTFSRALKGFSTRVPPEVVATMLQRDGAVVAAVVEDLQVDAVAQTLPWGISRIGTVQSASAAIDGSPTPGLDVDVFVLDTGIQTNHPDLNVVEARSFVRTEPSVDDGNGHGTAVAGVIGARDNTDFVVGVAPGARLHSYKVLDKRGSGAFSSIIAGLDRVLQWKAQTPAAQNKVVVNLSLGAYVGTTAYSVLDTAVANTVQRGVTVVVAAGNDGNNALYYTPAHVTEALTVGAYDAANRLTTWSNYGPAVDVLAPGANILSTYIRNRTAVMSGTSFAAPHVAGAAALYLRQHPTATPATVAAALLSLAASDYDDANPAIAVAMPNTTPRSVFVKDL